MPSDNGTFTIIHDKPICIGCAACAVIHPDRWIMEDSGLSHVVDSHKDGDKEVFIASDKEFEQNKDAADTCPVNCIHLEKDGKRII